MRNTPAEDICDFSSKLTLVYSTSAIALWRSDNAEFKQWQEIAVAKLARQGKPFELTATVANTLVKVTAKRI